MKGKRARELRAEGHKLAATAFIGRTGLTDAVAAEVAAQLKTRGLVKVKLSPDVAQGEDREELARRLAERASGELVEVRGFTILLSRHRRAGADGERR